MKVALAFEGLTVTGLLFDFIDGYPLQISINDHLCYFSQYTNHTFNLMEMMKVLLRELGSSNMLFFYVLLPRVMSQTDRQTDRESERENIQVNLDMTDHCTTDFYI